MLIAVTFALSHVYSWITWFTSALFSFLNEYRKGRAKGATGQARAKNGRIVEIQVGGGLLEGDTARANVGANAAYTQPVVHARTLYRSNV